MSDDFSLDSWPANHLRRRRGRSWLSLWGWRRRRNPLPLNDASADAFSLFNLRRGWGRRGSSGPLHISHNARRRRSLARRLTNTLSLYNPRTGVLVHIFMFMGAGRKAPGSPNDTFLSDANRAGAMRAVSVNRLDLARTKDHGPSLGSAVVLSQESGCSVLSLPLSVGRADGDSATTIVELIQLGGRATRIGIIIPLLEIGSSDTA